MINDLLVNVSNFQLSRFCSSVFHFGETLRFKLRKPLPLE